ncbi:hypothetical protein SAMN02745116_02588 [Pilibacter termitis]|uniref:Uncharacterized protein n=1 Tax=Pilibacter termitis TaxID=263852 RepID=A0A1T4RGF6_9ENTE|nr:hypothetical protein [Pilibacter termitis]SKA14886.1 hypothetical protein SAMN02745116_02588 [Pilibacter termitis]
MEKLRNFLRRMDYRIFVFSLLFLVVGFIAGTLNATSHRDSRYTPQITQRTSDNGDSTNRMDKFFHDKSDNQ